MPAATTHAAFALDALRIKPALQRQVSDRMMFTTGAQGPDLLFFSHMSVLPGSLKKYGNLMLEHKIWEVIHFFEKYCINDPELWSYFIGYLCHYALDRNVHPLVYAVTDQMMKDTGKSEGELHTANESEIDVWILHQRGRLISDYDVYKYLDINASQRHKLAVMYHKMFRQVFGIEIPVKKLEHGFREIYIWTRALAPDKTKHAVLYAAESLTRNHFVTAMMLYDTKPGAVINLEHKTYTTPWQTEINESFPALYGHAITYADRIIAHHEKADFDLDFCGKPVTD